MAVTIQGIKLTTANFRRNSESGVFELDGNYEIISSNNIVLAKQSYNGYQTVKLTPSNELQAKINSLLAEIERSLNTTLLGE